MSDLFSLERLYADLVGALVLGYLVGGILLVRWSARYWLGPTPKPWQLVLYWISAAGLLGGFGRAVVRALGTVQTE